MKKIFQTSMMIIMTVIVLCASSGCSSTDYIATVKAHKPLTTQNFPYTYGEVLDKYLISPEWTENVSGDSGTVTIRGEVKGDPDNLGDMVITIGVAPVQGDSSKVSITVKSLSYSGNSASGDDAGDFVAIMFLAYDNGYDSFVDFVNDNS